MGKSNQNLHTINLFLLFSLALSQPTEIKSNRSKKGSPKQMKVDDEADGTVSPTSTHTHKKNCLSGVRCRSVQAQGARQIGKENRWPSPVKRIAQRTPARSLTGLVRAKHLGPLSASEGQN